MLSTHLSLLAFIKNLGVTKDDIIVAGSEGNIQMKHLIDY
jgi:hypothetical protein